MCDQAKTALAIACINATAGNPDNFERLWDAVSSKVQLDKPENAHASAKAVIPTKSPSQLAQEAINRGVQKSVNAVYTESLRRAQMLGERYAVGHGSKTLYEILLIGIENTFLPASAEVNWAKDAGIPMHSMTDEQINKWVIGGE